MGRGGEGREVLSRKVSDRTTAQSRRRRGGASRRLAAGDDDAGVDGRAGCRWYMIRVQPRQRHPTPCISIAKLRLHLPPRQRTTCWW